MSHEVQRNCVKSNIDWAVRDSVGARLRILIRNLLKRYKYPPDIRGAVELF